MVLTFAILYIKEQSDFNILHENKSVLYMNLGVNASKKKGTMVFVILFRRFSFIISPNIEFVAFFIRF